LVPSEKTWPLVLEVVMEFLRHLLRGQTKPRNTMLATQSPPTSPRWCGKPRPKSGVRCRAAVESLPPALDWPVIMYVSTRSKATSLAHLRKTYKLDACHFIFVPLALLCFAFYESSVVKYWCLLTHLGCSLSVLFQLKMLLWIMLFFNVLCRRSCCGYLYGRVNDNHGRFKAVYQVRPLESKVGYMWILDSNDYSNIQGD